MISYGKKRYHRRKHALVGKTLKKITHKDEL